MVSFTGSHQLDQSSEFSGCYTSCEHSAMCCLAPSAMTSFAKRRIKLARTAVDDLCILSIQVQIPTQALARSAFSLTVVSLTAAEVCKLVCGVAQALCVYSAANNRSRLPIQHAPQSCLACSTSAQLVENIHSSTNGLSCQQ